MELFKLLSKKQIFLLSATRHYKIQPYSIDTSALFILAFGSLSTSCSARDIVRYFKSIGFWKSFKRKELQNYIDLQDPDDPSAERFCFNGLLISGDIIRDKFGIYYVAKKFVDKCYEYNPNRGALGTFLAER